MKRAAQNFGDLGDAKRFAGLPPHMAAKLLLSGKEASLVLGKGGATSKEIGQLTGTKLHLSGREELYPGTAHQELKISGLSSDQVSAALMQVFGVIAAEEGGRITGGEADVPEGAARTVFVVPKAAAAALIGRGGENIKELRTTTGLAVHIDEVQVGVDASAEQVVRFKGSLEGMTAAIPIVVERIAAFVTEQWFPAWVATSHAAAGGAQILPLGGKNDGKGGKGAKGKAAFDGAGAGGFGCAKGNFLPFEGTKGKSKGWESASFVEGPEAAAMQAQSMEAIVEAVNALPPRMKSPQDRGQQITFACPSDCVSALIGKGGAGTKEIAQATGAKIMIRELDGTPIRMDSGQAEKAVTISGNVLGVTVAYLHVAGRIGILQSRPPQGKGAPASGNQSWGASGGGGMSAEDMWFKKLQEEEELDAEFAAALTAGGGALLGGFGAGFQATGDLA